MARRAGFGEARGDAQIPGAADRAAGWGAAVLAWNLRPYPTWEIRQDQAAADGQAALLELSIVGRDGGEESGALWLTCRDGAPHVGYSPHSVQMIGGGVPGQGASIEIASYFLADLDDARSAPLETWTMPSDVSFFEHAEPEAFIIRLAAARWYEASGSGARASRFHVEGLAEFMPRIASACGLSE